MGGIVAFVEFGEMPVMKVVLRGEGLLVLGVLVVMENSIPIGLLAFSAEYLSDLFLLHLLASILPDILILGVGGREDHFIDEASDIMGIDIVKDFTDDTL